MPEKRDHQEIVHLMQVIVDSDIVLRFNLLADELHGLRDGMDVLLSDREKVEKLTYRVDAMELVIKQMRDEIAALQKTG